MNNKGAIELSMNFIVVMIISMVILAGGLGLFFKLKNNAQEFTDKVDSQTEARIKSIMLKNSYKVAVYPQDPIITVKEPATVYIGVTNIYPDDKQFIIDLVNVKYYEDDASAGDDYGNSADYFQISTNGIVTIPANSQAVKAMLLKIPAGSKKGQYVYTLRVTDNTNIPYAIVQVYAKN